MSKRRRSLKPGPGARSRSPQLVTLYRAMSEAEFQVTMRNRRFSSIPSSMGVKWFAEFPQHAARWGDFFAARDGVPYDRIVEVQINRAIADQLLRLPMLDGIGPARCATLAQLRGARIREYEERR